MPSSSSSSSSSSPVSLTSRISFAGVNCLLEDPSGQVAEYVRRHWNLPTSIINSPPRKISPESWAQVPNWPSPPPLRLNQLYQPSGATRWSRCLLLVDEAGAQALSSTSFGVLNFGLSYQSLNAVALGQSPIPWIIGQASGYPSSSFVRNNWNLGGNFSLVMFKLDIQPVSWIGDGNLYIVPLVCERYLWQSLNIVTTSANWGTSAAAPSSSSGSSTSSSSSSNAACTSNSSILRDIATALSSNALGSPAPEQYINGDLTPIGNPPCSVFRNGPIPAAAALDLLCWSQNVMLVPDDNSNVTMIGAGVAIQRYRIIGAGNANGQGSTGVWWGQEYAALTYGAQSVAGFDRYGGVGYDHPSQVAMSFTNPNSYSQPQYTSIVSTGASSSSASGTFPYSLRGGGTMGVRCLATADGFSSSSSSSSSSGPSTPANQSDLDSIAKLWAGRWYQQNTVQFDWVFNNMPVLKFCGLEDYILMDMSRKGPGNYSATTQWKSLPGHFGYEYVAIETAAHKCDCPAVATSSSSSIPITSCGCCACFNCITSSEATVGGCTAAPNGAPQQYIVTLGVSAFSDAGGTASTVTFTYGAAACSSSSSSSSSSAPSGCVWYSCPVTLCASASSSSSSGSSSGGPVCGVYQLTLVLTLDGLGQTVESIYINFISGTDFLGTGS